MHQERWKRTNAPCRSLGYAAAAPRLWVRGSRPRLAEHLAVTKTRQQQDQQRTAELYQRITCLIRYTKPLCFANMTGYTKWLSFQPCPSHHNPSMSHPTESHDLLHRSVTFIPSKSLNPPQGMKCNTSLLDRLSRCKFDSEGGYFVFATFL